MVCLASVALHAASAGARPVSLVLVGGRGDLGLTGCRGPLAPADDLARVATVVAAAGAERLVVGRGGLLARRAPQWLGGLDDAVAPLLAAVGVQRVALGPGESGLLPARLDALAAALRAAGTPLWLDNLACEPSRAALCSGLAGTIHRVGGVAVGLIAVQGDDPRFSIDPAARIGLRWLPAAPVVRAASDRLRGAGAQLVLLLALRGRTGRAGRDVIALAEAVRPGVDLVVTDAFGGDRAHPRRLHLGAGEPICGAPDSLDVVGLPDEPSAVMVLDLDVEAAGDRAQLHAATLRVLLPDAATPRSPAVAALVDAARAGHCARWAGPVLRPDPPPRPDVARAAPAPGGAAAGVGREGVAREDVVRVLLATMRQQARADVALLPTRALRTGPARYHGGASVDDLAALTATDERVVVAERTGQQLVDLLASAPADGPFALQVYGLDRKGPTWLLHGLPLDGSLRYRVVTVESVAHGMDGAVAAFAAYAPLGPPGRHALVEVAMRAIAGRSASPAALIAALAPRSRWEVLASAQLGSSGAQASGTTTARDPRLNTVNSANLALRVDALAWLHDDVHDWQTRLLLDAERTVSLGETPAAWTTADELRLDTSWALSSLRPRLRWSAAAPVPVASVRGRTQLLAASGAARLLDGDALTGLRWQPTVRARWELGGGVRGTHTGDLAPWTPLLMLSGRLRRVEVGSLGPFGLDVDAELDARWLGPGARDRVELQGRLGLWLDTREALAVFATGEWLELRGGGAAARQLEWRLGLAWSMRAARVRER